MPRPSIPSFIAIAEGLQRMVGPANNRNGTLLGSACYCFCNGSLGGSCWDLPVSDGRRRQLGNMRSRSSKGTL